MKVAIIHDWLAAMRGGERCVEAFCELFPHADLFTLFHFQGKVSCAIEQMPIRTSFIQNLPLVERFYRYYLPLFPYAIERFDLSEFDVILSSSHCVAKGILRPPGALHISYTYTPMRYAWDLYDAYFDERVGPFRNQFLRAVMARLRRWDLNACERVDQFVAISHHVAERIRRHYKRDAVVVYPPVNFDRFTLSEKDEGFYLVVSAFAPYKRVDLAIEACNQTKRSLKVIGAGQDFKRIQQLAGPTVELLGWQPDDIVTEYYRRCRALLFPGEEDFGIVPLEAMACGKPVIAFAKGGALETVLPLNRRPEIQRKYGAVGMPSPDALPQNPTGVFFYDQTPEAAVAIVGRSGSGKSTLLRCIAGLETVQGGGITVCGHEVGRPGSAARAQLRRDVGMVFQSYNLFPHLNVERNITLALTLVKKQSREEAKKRAAEVLSMVGLTDKIAAYPEQLSGGQQQRVAIARSLALQPQVMLFDEVTSALDPELTAEVLGVMEDLAHQGMTMISVTHEMGFARRVADVVVFMHQGKVWESGPTAEVFANPRTAEFKQFVGSEL